MIVAHLTFYMRSRIQLSIVLIALLYVTATVSFGPIDLVTTPRLGPAIPNGNGTFAVFTQSDYSLHTDDRRGGLYLIPLNVNMSGKPRLIVNDTSADNPLWLDEKTVLYMTTENGQSMLRTYDTGSEDDRLVYTVSGILANIKAVKISTRTLRFAFSTKVAPDGSIVNSNDLEPPEALVYDQLWVRFWDRWMTQNKNSIFSGTLRLRDNGYEIAEPPSNMLNSSRGLRELNCSHLSNTSTELIATHYPHDTWPSYRKTHI